MASGALFGSASNRAQSKNLVEFRAGKMYMKGKMVHPDKRKGQVYVYQSDDSLMHFCWKDRTKGNVEDVSKYAYYRLLDLVERVAASGAGADDCPCFFDEISWKSE